MRDEIVVTYDEADFVDAYRPAARRKSLSILVLALAAMLALLIVVLLLRYPGARTAFQSSPLILGLTGAILLAATLVLALIAVTPALLRRAARSTLIDHPGMLDPVRFEFDREEFAARTTFTHARYPWSQLWSWRETERAIIVLPTPRNFYVIPKRTVDAEVLERLRERLSQARQGHGARNRS